MTQEQATTLQTAQNLQIGAGVDIAKTYVFLYWDLSEFAKQYDTVLLPFKYDVQILAATDSQLLAFKRVANATFAAGGWATLLQYVTVFDAQAALDAELAVYLGL